MGETQDVCAPRTIAAWAGNDAAAEGPDRGISLHLRATLTHYVDAWAYRAAAR